MNEKELKQQLLAAGATEEQIAKINFARIEEIISQAGNLDELCNLMVKNYPGFNVQEFKKAVTEGANAKDSEEAVDLSDEALENVAGGSLGSWIKKNKDWLIPVAAIGASGLLIGAFAARRGKATTASPAEPSSPILSDGKTSEFIDKNVEIMKKGGSPSMNLFAIDH